MTRISNKGKTRTPAYQFLQPIRRIVSNRGRWQDVELRCGHQVFGVPSKYKRRQRLNCTQCDEQGKTGSVPQPIYQVVTLGEEHWVVGNDGTGWTMVSTTTKSRAKAERDLARVSGEPGQSLEKQTPEG